MPKQRHFFKNNRGATLLSFLILLPVILALSLGGIQYSSLIRLKMKVNHQCRTHVLKSQNILISGTNKLLALNPYAEALIVAEILADLATKSGVPSVVLGGHVALKIAKLSQKALNLTQISIRKSSELLALKKIKNSISEVAKTNLNPLFKASVKSTTFYTKMRVKKTKPKKTASPYERSERYEELQKLWIRWEIQTNLVPFDVVNPEFLNFKISGKCTSTPKKRNAHWYSKL